MNKPSHLTTFLIDAILMALRSKSTPVLLKSHQRYNLLGLSIVPTYGCSRIPTCKSRCLVLKKITLLSSYLKGFQWNLKKDTKKCTIFPTDIFGHLYPRNNALFLCFVMFIAYLFDSPQNLLEELSIYGNCFK